jgi:glycolate oxidase
VAGVKTCRDFTNRLLDTLHCTPIKPEELSVDEWHDRTPKLLGELYRIVKDLGHKRKPYMSVMFTEAELEAQRRVKAIFDPDGVLNPGKIV